jgi:hypothetical protein
VRIGKKKGRQRGEEAGATLTTGRFTFCSEMWGATESMSRLILTASLVVLRIDYGKRRGEA